MPIGVRTSSGDRPERRSAIVWPSAHGVWNSPFGGQLVVSGRIDLHGVFDPAPGPGNAATLPLAAAAFVAMLQLTLVCEGRPLRGRGEPADWVSYAGLNAIGVGVILHVAIGKRFPFA